MNDDYYLAMERTKDLYPRWISKSANLREVWPGLYVGNMRSPHARMNWGTVVDLYGSSDPDVIPGLVSIPFNDGGRFPEGAMDRISDLYLHGPKPMLIHCQAGLSRSASAAYGLLVRHHRLSHAGAHRRVYAGVRGFPMARTLKSARSWARRG